MRSRSVLWSFNYAIQGIVYALRTQRNMRLHVLAAVTVFIACLVLHITGFGLIAVMFAITFVVNLIADLVVKGVHSEQR